MTATILCIEDNHFRMRFSTKLLQLMGYNVLTASMGLVGVNIASKKRPDLILIDTELSHLNSVYMLKRLRHMARTRRTPTIAVVTKRHESELQHYLDAGFDACLVKSNLHLELQKTVKSLLHQAEQRTAKTS